MTKQGRICGEMIVYEGGEAAAICREPYGHKGRHPTMSVDEYRARLASSEAA